MDNTYMEAATQYTYAYAPPKALEKYEYEEEMAENITHRHTHTTSEALGKAAQT